VQVNVHSTLHLVSCVLAGNLGGTLGLCIGASLLTICEFIQFGVFSLIRCVNRKREQESRKNVIHVQVEPNRKY